MLTATIIARRHPLSAFFCLAFLFTWALLPSARTSIPISLIALFGPAVAAVVVARLSGPVEMQALWRRLTQWRVSPVWYVAALLLPIPISALRCGLSYLAGAHGPIVFQPISVLSLIVFVMVLGEEVGWRGFALPRLVEQFGPWTASAVLGILWALWHLPLFFLEGMPQYGTPFVPYAGYTIGLSLILTFLALETQQSILIATLFHGAVNTFGLVNEAASPMLKGWTDAVSYTLVAAVICAFAWRRPRRTMTAKIAHEY